MHKPIYADDCFLAELAGAIDGAFSFAYLSAGLVGLRLGKEQTPSPPNSILFSTVTLLPEFLTARFPGRKRNDLVFDLEEVRASWCLAPGQASKFRGDWGVARS